MSKSKVFVSCLLIAWAAGVAACAAQAAAPPAAKTKVSDGWVVIHSKGQKFQFGQEFPGRRWTYTFPAHEVSFTYDFTMDSKQVTQEEYKAVTGENPTLHPGDEQRPIDNVTWFDAVLYCNALSKRDGLDPVYTYTSVKGDAKTGVKDLAGIAIDIKKNGYRLLTSAEYEYVIRAGTTTTGTSGNDNAKDEGKSKDYAWSVLNAKDKPHASRRHAQAQQVRRVRHHGQPLDVVQRLVCGTAPKGAYPKEPQVDQTGPASGTQRIARGGAFKNDVSGHERSAYHWQWSPGSQFRGRLPHLPDGTLRQPVTLFDAPAWIATAEDVILHNLYWNRLTPSQRQLGDAAGVMRCSRRRSTTITCDDGRHVWTSGASLTICWPAKSSRKPRDGGAVYRATPAVGAILQFGSACCRAASRAARDPAGNSAPMGVAKESGDYVQE